VVGKSTPDGPIVLQKIDRDTAIIDVVGLSPVIPHKWSEKALRMMRESQSGVKTRAKKDAKDPQAEAEGSTYYLPDGRPGIPATAFKAAMVGAIRLFDGLTMVVAKSALFVEGDALDEQGNDLVAISGPRILREDTPRNATGVADLRYRYAYGNNDEPWRATLKVTYLPRVIDQQSILLLLDAAGNGGVGDWRPSAPKSATGTFGRFEVVGL